MKAQEKILVFCSREICYLSGNFFAHQLAGAFEEAGYETTVCEFTSKDDLDKVLSPFFGKNIVQFLTLTLCFQDLRWMTGHR